MRIIHYFLKIELMKGPRILRLLPFLGIPFSFVVFFSTLGTLSAETVDPLTVTIDIPGGEFQYGQTVHITASDPNAKIFWTLYPNAGPGAGNVSTGEAFIEVRRTLTLHFFAFRGYDDETPIHEARFVIESAEENEYLKIIEVDPNPPRSERVATIVIMNLSRYPSDISGWRLSSRAGEILLPEKELMPGEAMRVVAPMERENDFIGLWSSNGVMKDYAEFHSVPEGMRLLRGVDSARRKVSELFSLESTGS